MKRFTLLFLFMCSMAVSFGQIQTAAKQVLVNEDGTTNLSSTSMGQIKGGGDVFWQTTFNWADETNPRGWSLPAGWDIKDVSGTGFPWMWVKDTIKWGTNRRVNPPSFFATKSDGFLSLPIQYLNYNDGVGGVVPADSYVETPKIDCSTKSSVVVKFSTYWNLCCLGARAGNIEMLVTTDNGGHLATYDLQFNIAANNGTPERYRNVELNISDVAAGSPNVQIRFYFHGGSYAYYWMIDDLKLVEGYENDLVLEDYWLDFDGGIGETVGQINYWPLSQMGIPGTVSGTVGGNSFRAALLNRGSNDSENARLQVKVLKNGTEVASDVSASNTIWTLERDSATIATPYVASDYGDYRFDYTAIADNGEEVPLNNNTSIRFTVNDTLGHRADFTAESGAGTGGWVGGDNAGDMCGVGYDIYAPCEVNSISAFINSFNATQTPSFQYVLIKEIDGVREEWMVSDIVDCDSSMLKTYVTLPLSKDGETEFLQPGSYATVIRMWGVDPNDVNGSNGVNVGYDMTTKPGRTLMYQIINGNWYGTDNLNMIGFNIAATGGPTQAPATFNVDMTKHIASGEFKPGTDFVDVAGTFNSWAGSAHLTDPEADGIYTITIDGMPVNKVIEYKYRINGNWDTSEYANGGPNRKYTVRYWNVLNNVYNSGNTAGVDPTSLVASFSVYPNPTQGAFKVEVTNKVASDLVISLTNIQGQVVYQNKVAGVLTHTETIDNKLAKGLYFLSVNNGQEVKVQKVVVQ
jgi:hypothetical protein